MDKISMLKIWYIVKTEDYNALKDMYYPYKYYKADKTVGLSFLSKLLYLSKKYPALIAIIKKYVISNPEKINKCNYKKYTPLYIAIVNGCSFELIKHLLDNGAILCIKKNTIELASKYNYESCLELVDHLIDLKVSGYPIHTAVKNNNIDMVKKLIKVFNINDKNTLGFLPIHYACLYPTLEILILLLELGANIEEKTKFGYTSLLLSIMGKKENYAIVEILINNGANINYQNNNGLTALHAACQNNHANIVSLLINNGAIYDVQDNEGNTPLHIACKNKSLACAKILIMQNYSCTILNKEGISPIHLACYQKNYDIIEFMLNFDKTIIDHKTINGATLMHIACENDDVDMVSLLISNNAAINIKEHKEYSPLTICCITSTPNSLIIIKKIFANGGIIDATLFTVCIIGLLKDVSKKNMSIVINILNEICNCNTFTPEMLDKLGISGKSILSYVMNNYDIVELLVKKGANVNLLDRNENTIYHNIISNNAMSHAEKVKYIAILVKYGADKNLKNKDGICIATFLEILPKKVEPVAGSVLHECIICYTDPATHAIIPCGHLILCENCNKTHVKKLKECPMCKGKISQVCKIYF